MQTRTSPAGGIYRTTLEKAQTIGQGNMEFSSRILCMEFFITRDIWNRNVNRKNNVKRKEKSFGFYKILAMNTTSQYIAPGERNWEVCVN